MTDHATKSAFGPVVIELKETSQPLVFENVKNTYQKGDLFCIYSAEGVTKIPLANIWRIKEPYNA